MSKPARPNPWATQQPHGPAGPVRTIFADPDAKRDIWFTVGPDCPWNDTPGIRQVRHFTSLREAREAGFDPVL
jgi:hypothetical protein